VHHSKADARAAADPAPAQEIDRHLFEIPLQAAIGSRVIARETIKPLRKNVTAKCYGGDVTASESCWRSEGGQAPHEDGRNVEIPQAAFMAVLESETE